MPAALRGVTQRSVFGNWSMAHVIPDDKWPQKLFFYWKGESMPRFTFIRESKTTHWLEQGKVRPYRFSTMSKKKAIEWVGLKKPND